LQQLKTLKQKRGATDLYFSGSTMQTIFSNNVISQEGNLKVIAIVAHNNEAVRGSIIQIIFHLRSCE